MSGNHRQNVETGSRFSGKPPEFIRVSPAWLTIFIALNGFAVAVVVVAASLAIQFAVISWNAPPQACADDSKPAAVCPAPETSAQEIVGALNAIDSNLTEISKQLGNQKTLSPCDPVGLLVSEEWARNRNLVVDPKENPWINDMVDALQQIQKKINDDSGIRDVVIDPEKNQALIKALQGRVVVSGCSSSNQPGTTTSSQETADASNIDQRLRKRIRQKMCCNEVAFSEYIHFPTGRHLLIETAEKGKINNFMRNDGARATKWGVFGFASESGSNEMNRELSWQRACAVKEHICKNDADSSLCELDCETYPKDRNAQTATGLQCLSAKGDKKTSPLLCFLGEQHFINGVADSRSVVIAACKTKE